MKLYAFLPKIVSLRTRLLAGILLPVALFIAVDTFSLYGKALESINTAYDRSLLASARSIGELLRLEDGVLRATVPYAALEIFEADNASRMVYRISGFNGEFISGFEDFPRFEGRIPQTPLYPALVHFYDGRYESKPMRMAALWQPVSATDARGMALIQVAETLEIREKLARKILRDTIIRQLVLMTVIGLIAFAVTTFALRPFEQMRRALNARSDEALLPLQAQGAPREMQPMIDAINTQIARAARLIENQSRFVRDASHQLRTPLAVLKIQVQSGLSGDAPPQTVLHEISETVDRATELANQMLALTKVEQLRQQGSASAQRLDDIVRAMALELSPLIAQKSLDFELVAEPVEVHAHEWMLRELTRNLLGNAIRHTPAGGAMSVRVHANEDGAVLTVSNDGTGLPTELKARLFEPFSTADPNSSSGLGLTICKEIVDSIKGRITLDDRKHNGHVDGVVVHVSLPGARNT